jgi:hypothetical protein
VVFYYETLILADPSRKNMIKEDMMKKHILILSFCFVIIFLLFFISCKTSTEPTAKEESVILNHTKATLSLLTSSDIENAKSKLHIAYGHTSHGSQLITGMEGLVIFKGALYSFSDGGSEGSLDLRDKPFAGASDLGNPDRTAWATATRNYLDNNPDINVIIWSWCGQVSSATEEDINTYLTLMTQLESDYPQVRFVYMTGHLDGTGEEGNLHLRNEQIRKYCRENDKLLYDFADIESYEPGSNTNYMVLNANDGCYYDSDEDGSQDANWAIDWQNSHTLDEDWYECSSAHSQPLNANLKAYAAWNLWVIIAN